MADATELIVEFVNTNDIEGGRDALGTPDLLRTWLSDRGLVGPGTQVDADGHARAIAVREGVRALARANNEEPLDEGAVRRMNEAAGHAPLT
ncbi:MAG TPA: ABATE domain-containing protein, partial [Candidatus Limnocylindria bacterium]|nr:ABATE domain-containing protein [Candidatus Limnocylindria bacterium]